MKALLYSFLLAVFALAASADTDVTGKWSGSFVASTPQGETQNATAFLILKQSGSDIAGTVGPSEDEQFPIVKGKIEGGQITIEADHGGQTLKLRLVVAEGHIKGEATMAADEGTMTAKLDVTRVK